MNHYLTTGDIQQFNTHFVGADQLRDFGLLESAVLRPQATAFGDDAYPTLHEKAAALLHSLARNHPFIDGNKRTAWAAAEVFYMLNGFEIVIDDGQVIGLVVDIAEGQVGVPDIAAKLKEWAVPIDLGDDGGVETLW